MSDLTPALLEKIRSDYNKRIGTSTTIRVLKQKKDKGLVTYDDAVRFAREIGNIRAKTFKNVLRSDMLPDGKMYYNIANEVVNDSLKEDYRQVTPFCVMAQTNKNKKRKIGVKAKEVEIDQENIDGIVNMICASEQYDDKSALFEMACATFAKHIVDRSKSENAKLHQRLGLKVTITRVAEAGCCPWCSDMAGNFDIGHAPDDVWGRHNDCNCTIDYDSK